MKTFLLVLMAILISTGCRSAEEAFLDGQRAENAGNNEAAISYYLETIRLKPDFFQAKERLAIVAQKEIDDNYLKAESLLQNGQGQNSLAQIKDLQNLYKQVIVHAPDIKIPGDLNSLRNQALTLIRRDLFKRAQVAEQNKEWDQALGFLTEIENYAPNSDERLKIFNDKIKLRDNALRQQITAADGFFESGQYEPCFQALAKGWQYADTLQDEQLLNDRKSNYGRDIMIREAKILQGYLKDKQYLEASERLKALEALESHFTKPQLDAVRVLNIKLHNSWAADLFEQNRYKEAWHQATFALTFEESNQQALDLREKALKLGQISFLLLPVMTTGLEEVNFSKKIDSHFNNGPARNMPPFTALVPEFDMRDAFRAARVNPQEITRQQALAVAQKTGASFIIFRELTDLRYEEEFFSTTKVAVKKADNKPGVMKVRKGTLTLNCRFLVTLVDALSGHRVYSQKKDSSAKLEFEQGFLDGPEKDYVLSNQQKSLLAPPGAQDLEVLEEAAAKEISDFFGDEVFPAMEKLVP